MSDEIKVILAAVSLILTTIVGLYIKLQKNATNDRLKKHNQNVKDRIADQKLDQSDFDFLIAKYKDLLEEGKKELRVELEELRIQVKHYQTEHFDCSKKLAAATVRIESLEANEKVLIARVAQLEGN